MKIYGFMHVAVVNNWREILAELFLKLRASGLYDKSSRIFLGLVGDENAACPFADAKVTVAYRSPRLEDAEFPTLQMLQDRCRREHCLVYYVHTKGVFHNSPCVVDWRRLMEHFVILRHDRCLQKLSTNDICGVNWHEEPWPHFSGNFWWARSDYTAALPSVANWRLGQHWSDDRHICERWIGMASRRRVFCAHSSGIDHYEERYPRSRYTAVCEADWALPDQLSTWAGIENRFQDLVEPVGVVHRVIHLTSELGLSTLAIATSMPQAAVIRIVLPKKEQGNCAPLSAHTYLQPYSNECSNAFALEMTSEQALSVLPGPIDVLIVDNMVNARAASAAFSIWAPSIRPGGGMLLFRIHEHPQEFGAFFRMLKGRKVEDHRQPGIGAWYKPMS